MSKLYFLTSVADVVASVTLNYQLIQNSLEFVFLIITVDDIDIKTIPLNDSRSKISLLSQSPVLFLGTHRKNLNEQIWKPFDKLDFKIFF
jgi:ABC-type multidrug transport system fused ATPase/permease subunit